MTQEGFWKGWKDSMSRHKFIHNWRHMTYWHLFSPNELRIQIISCSDSHCRWGLLPPKEHLATSTDSFDCHDYSRSLTSSWERPGMLPKSYHALDSASHSPPTHSKQNVAGYKVIAVEKTGLEANGQLYWKPGRGMNLSTRLGTGIRWLALCG